MNKDFKKECCRNLLRKDENNASFWLLKLVYIFVIYRFIPIFIHGWISPLSQKSKL